MASDAFAAKDGGVSLAAKPTPAVKVTPAVKAVPATNALSAATVRRAFLQLLALAMIPLLVLGVSRSALQIERNQAQVEARLSERVVETARAEAEVIRTTQAVLRLLSENNDIRSGGTLCDLGLAKINASFAAFSNIARQNADGSLACSAIRPGADTVWTTPDWWPRLAGKTSFFVTGPHWGALSKRQVLVAVQPIRTQEGAFDGALTASIDLGWMQQSLRRRGLGNDAVALVLDHDGKPLVSSQPVEFAPFDVTIGPGRVADRTDANGRLWTYAVAPLQGSFDGNRMLHVAFAMPRAQLFSAAWWQAGIILVQPLIAVMLASLAIWFGANRLVLRWLGQLRQMATSFTAGDYRHDLADFDDAPAEFRDLADAFSEMGEAVERRDSKLRAALDRQNHLVKEIHHRVKNNLQIVMSLISLQADRLDTKAAQSALSQTRLRISALALVHRLLYDTVEQTTIPAAELLDGVSDLVAQTFRDCHPVKLRVKFGKDELTIDSAIPLALWLVDALSNAFQHGFPDGRSGTIEVSLIRDGRFGVLEVADDGVGFSADMKSAPSARGFRILNGIGRQVGGQTDIISTADAGTIVRLRYPAGVTARSTVV